MKQPSRLQLIILAIVGILLASLWLIPGPSRSGAEVVIDPQHILNQASQSWTATIKINSNQPINSVDTTIRYPTDLVEVRHISIQDSDLELTVFQPDHQKDAGTIRFVQSSLQGHQGPDTQVATITFKGIKQGQLSLDVDSATIVAHNGQGTNVAHQSLNQSIASWLLSQWPN